MKEKRKKSIINNTAPSTIISFRYAIIALIIALILMFIIPKVLNYGPDSINTPFDIQMSYISYTMQFLILIIASILLIVVITKILLRDIDKWYRLSEEDKYKNIELLKKIRKKCFNLPYFFFTVEVFAPPAIAFFVLSITGSHSVIMIAKIIVLLTSFTALLAVVSFIFSKELYNEILTKTYVEGFDIGMKIGMRRTMAIVVFPTFLAAILLTALIGYSASVIEQENILFNINNKLLLNTFDKEKIYTEDEIYELAKNIELYKNTDTIFILSEDNVDIVKGENKVSYFVTEYIKQIADKHDGRIYDSYGVDTQGSSIKLKTSDNKIYYVGIIYDIVSSMAGRFLTITSIFVTIITGIVIYIYGTALSKSLHQIYQGFRNICNNSDKTTLLPVVSNDEIGDLVMAFNDIQKLNNNQIQDIQNKQNMLIERERLASLGQMVGRNST